MQFYAVLVAALVAAVALTASTVVDATDFPFDIPNTTVNLDLPPAERWADLLKNVIETNGFDNSFGHVLAYWETIPAVARPLIDLIASDLEKYLPAEYVEEIRGGQAVIAELGYGEHLPVSTIVALNLLYTLTAGCTSIVSQAPGGGDAPIWHSRNLDWSFDNYSMANLTYHVDFQRGGETVYSCVTFVGYVGCLTGMREGGFTITIDERDTPDKLQVPEDILHLIIDHAQADVFLTREVLANNASYADAIEALSTTRISTQVYFIVGGVGNSEGCVITRSWDDAVMGIWSIGPDSDAPWFVLETNYDHWEAAPSRDDRRAVAIKAMTDMGQANLSPENLWKVMETPGNSTTRGVFNSMTQYTVVMSAASGFFQGKIWQ